MMDSLKASRLLSKVDSKTFHRKDSTRETQERVYRKALFDVHHVLGF